MSLSPAQTCVVITRLAAQAEAWASALHTQGFATRRLPLIELRGLVDEAQRQAAKNKILDFDLYQKVIFVSQNAVDYGMSWLDDYWPQLPIGIDYFAVGATTAKKLADYGLKVTDLAVSETGGMTSEDLLQAPQLQAVQGDKILIVRGLGGRGHLAETLRQRGASVDFCEVYERLLPAAAATELQALITDMAAERETRFILALHSGESLQNILALVATLDSGLQASINKTLRALPVLVPSERIAALAVAEGFSQVISADNATDQAMSAALLRYCEQA